MKTNTKILLLSVLTVGALTYLGASAIQKSKAQNEEESE